MSPIAPRRLARFRSGQFGRFVGDSFFTGIWQGAISAADLAQIVLITHALGLVEFGRLALVVAFVFLVGQFFDVRVSTATTTFGAQKLETDIPSAAGIFQFSYVIDAVTGVVGFAVVAALAPLVGPSLVGDEGSELILLFALTLLISTVDNSSLAILRLFGRFPLIAAYTVPLEAFRIGLVAAAVHVYGDLRAIIIALLVHEAARAVVHTTMAARSFKRASGGLSLARPALALVANERRAMLRMVFHTNVISYSRLAQTHLPTILLGAVSGPLQTAVYKVGMAAAALVGRLADPPYAAILPRVSRLWASGQHADVRQLLGQISKISIPAMAVAFAVAVWFREPIMEFLGGERDTHGATTVMVVGSAAYAINGALFWNAGLLFAADRARVVSAISLVGLAVQGVLLAALVVPLNATGAAIAFLASYVVVNVAATEFARRTLAGEVRG